MTRSANRLLQACSAGDYAVLAPHLEAIRLPIRFVLEEANAPIEHVYFLESGLASVLASTSEAERIEVCIIGREGMSGASVVNGSDRSAMHTFIQLEGAGQRIAVGDLRAVMEDAPALQRLFLLFNESRAIQVAHTALANGRHTIEERLARWILMCHDRDDGDDIALTHEFLSLMLGVRRAGVTTALHILEGALIIRSTRGNIHIRDRVRLETVAGESYGMPEQEYERLMGQYIDA
jgi:CRP-like cAMP-binding protein